MHMLKRASVGLLVLGTVLPLCIVLHSASADFVGFDSEWRTDVPICSDTSNSYIDQPLQVCNIFAVFDDPGDVLLAIATADIQAYYDEQPDVFYQHLFNFWDGPPSCEFLSFFPSLVCDSYVTVGVHCEEPAGNTILNAGWDEEEFNNNGHIVEGWWDVYPEDGLWTAGNYPGLRLLIAQLSVVEGGSASGTAIVIWRFGDQGDIMWEEAFPLECPSNAPCPADFDGSGDVGAGDLAILLGNWGSCEDCGDCPGEMNGNCVIDAFDLATLLGAWGACP